jgi:hypothetical protein
MLKVCVLTATLVLGAPVFAAGIDSRSYTCPDLQALIAAHRFVFINNPDFEDFAVADQSECPSGGILVWRSVPTKDRPECIVYWCGGGRGGGSE